MILVDTSVWVDHFRRGNARLAAVLEGAEVLCHPFVIGELACGDLGPRREILSRLAQLPQAPPASHEEVLAFIESRRLMGSGIGWVDAHLMSSAVLAGAPLWTLDKRLAEIARSLEIHAEPPSSSFSR